MTDGGPAFPSHHGVFMFGFGEINHDNAGMSLRDYFAGQALALGADHFKWTAGQMHADIAAEAYRVADAMLKARST